MAIIIPFTVPLSITLTALATGSDTYAVSAGQQLEIDSIYQKSTGAFDLTAIYDNRGRQYSSAAPGNGLDSDFIQDVATPNIAMSKLSIPLIIEGNNQITIQVTDTSNAGNTVELMLSGKLTIG